MAKRDDYMLGRSEGMAFALKIAKEGGVEALEKEIRMRNIWGLHQISVSKKDLEEIKDKVTARTVSIVECVALLTLRDEFGFGRQRGLRFMERFEGKIQCVIGDPADGQTVSLDDYVRAVQEEMGIKIEIDPGLGRRKKK